MLRGSVRISTHQLILYTYIYIGVVGELMYNNNKCTMATPTCPSLPSLVGNKRELITKIESSGVRKGAWTGEEDELLKKCIQRFGEGKWSSVPSRAGLKRCRKSCRLRWLNYLSPVVNREKFNEDEIDLIFRLHKLLGNRWSLIAGRIPGRTANDIKNLWNTHLGKKKSLTVHDSPKNMDDKDNIHRQAKTKDNGEAGHYGKGKTKAIYRPQPTKAAFFTVNDANPMSRYKEPTMMVDETDDYLLRDLMNEKTDDIMPLDYEFSMTDDALLLDTVIDWEELLKS